MTGGRRATTGAGERSVRVFMRSRSRLRRSPRTGASERSEVAPGAGKETENRRAKAVSAKRLSADGPEHQTKSGRAERPLVYAVAEPAATPEDRQSEHSAVCRDRATEKCQMPEGRRGAERSPATTDDGTREGGRGRTARQAVHQAGRERRRGATPATAMLAANRTDQ
ncbi:MAG: hypothetical protein Q8K00_01865 [Syntrophales bacterium]|nr:hypothetical protein [Syntrophales bacterium]